MSFLSTMNLPDTIIYIANVPFFWSSMGLITAIGMLIGSIIYNGDLQKVSKAILTVIVYVFLLGGTNLNRIYDVYCRVGISDSVMAFAGTVTALIISIFYISGMLLGVYLTKIIRKKVKNDTRSIHN